MVKLVDTTDSKSVDFIIVRVRVSLSVILIIYIFIIILDKNWYSILKNELTKAYMQKLFDFISNERKNKNIYPPHDNMFTCLNKTPFKKVKVVILGQDPYCSKGQADGLAFSVPYYIELPGSLKNIYKELYDDLGIPIAQSGCLFKWAEQGVLLLNSVLTVEENKPGSHFGKGWEKFTDNIIDLISYNNNKTVFVLWGKYASKKQKFINLGKHVVFTASHPSDKSANVSFFGSRPFSKINMYLKLTSRSIINWNVV